MRGRILVTVLALLALAACARGAAPAQAAPAVPRGWVGVMAGGELVSRPGLLPGELGRMRADGVGAIRVAFDWWTFEPEAGRYRWATLDRVVGEAARRDLAVLPVVLGAPGWAAAPPTVVAPLALAPRRPADFGRAVAAAARRYGSRGTFWRAHPRIPRRPIRTWQLWNEPNLRPFLPVRDWVREYMRLLRAGRTALRRVDRRARVALAGLTNRSWIALEQLYRARAGGLFDLVALHPYTLEPGNVVELVRRAREVMARHRDRRKSVLLTELGWPASYGRTVRDYPFSVTERVRQVLLRTVLGQLRRVRVRLRIGGIYWYSWLTDYTLDRADDPFAYSGLREMTSSGPEDTPSLGAFRETVRLIRRAGP